MKDQVDSLNELGIPSAFINSSLSQNDFMQTIENAMLGMYRILYVAPERLNSDSFLRLMQTLTIPFIAIDEAHCVSQWGHDFRPSYTQIASMIAKLKTRPVVAAFTATATKLVANDIIHCLALLNPYTLTTGFDRENLSFHVSHSKNKMEDLIDFLTKHPQDSGIIYCSTRKQVDSLYQDLSQKGYLVSRYHAGMNDNDKTVSQNDFVYDRTNLMIATNAFGMGIDKSNVRFVIHFNMPKDLESYYQEAGRAGRDGLHADCLLLFSRSDIVTNQFIIGQASSQDHSVEYQKLNDMIDYCNTDKCLRKYILEYFGEVPTFQICHQCSNCNSDTELTDITQDAQKILSCVKRMGQRYGTNLVTDVLKGAHSSKIQSLGFDHLPTYGILKEYPKDTIKELIAFLIADGYLICIGTQYPVLILDKKADSVLFGDTTITMKRKIEKESIQPSTTASSFLLDRLKQLRKEIAYRNHVPPFVIFTDATLLQMATVCPTTEDAFLKISGVGTAKFEKYGQDFIDCILANSSQKITHEVNKEKKEDTKMLSCNLYLEGKSIAEIATIRGLTKQTVESHLLYGYEQDILSNLEKEIQTEYKDKILHAIEQQGAEKLRPIKDTLPDAVTYLDIKYYLVQRNKSLA